MIERYREDYPGEFVITKTVIRNGKKEQEREWIDNPIKVEHVSERGTCIAEDPSLKDTLYKRIEQNNGGNLGKMKMQVYGVENVWQRITPNFIVCQVPDQLEEMIKRGYSHKSVVYTSASYCIKYPGEFYLTPYGLSLRSHALAVWLACFDGHKEIYLVGYNNDGTKQKMINSIVDIMKAYKDVRFIQVTNNNSPHEWKEQINFSSMDMNTYISHCDV